MQFDNPIPTIDNDADSSNTSESGIFDSHPEERDVNLQEQLRQQVESNFNLQSVLHGTFHAVLVFVLFMMFLEVEFGILENNIINGLIALALVLGIASTAVKSNWDDKVYDPNYVPSQYWRFVVFIFFIVGELFLLLLVQDLIDILSIPGLASLAGLVGAVNLAVLWQFAEEEFDDYIDPYSDRRTVVSNYLMMVVVSVFLLGVGTSLPTLTPIISAVSLFLLLVYCGFFWTYAVFNRRSINVLSRLALSFMISIMLLPLSALLLDRLGITITPTVIIILNFVLCTLGFLVYNARPRLEQFLYAR